MGNTARNVVSIGSDARLLSKFQKFKRHTKTVKAHDAILNRLHDSWTDYAESLLSLPITPEERWEMVKRHPDAINHSKLSKFLEPDSNAADRLFEEIIKMPATSKAGRLAKAAAFFANLLGEEWAVKGEDCDFEKRCLRGLLCEFAGITEDELLSAV